MPTVTLVQATFPAGQIAVMRAQPMGINLNALAGDGIQFTCNNPLAQIQGAKTVDITFNNAQPPQSLQVSSVMS